MNMAKMCKSSFNEHGEQWTNLHSFKPHLVGLASITPRMTSMQGYFTRSSRYLDIFFTYHLFNQGAMREAVSHMKDGLQRNSRFGL